MKIAVIGAGIAGLMSAWLLSRRHDVTLYEANDYLGGHTHTHNVELHGERYAVDSGFIIHNPVHYPLLTRLFDELGVASQPTTMSFSVSNEDSGLEYNATSLDALYCQRRNLLSWHFHGMVRDLLRFYREAPAVLRKTEPGPTLGEYLAEHHYGAAFRNEHLVPMASALWSAPAERILEFPARHLVQFMVNHQLLNVWRRPQWRVVRGGSATYVAALRRHWPVRERIRCAVQAVRRSARGVEVTSPTGSEDYDHAVLACHSDQALTLLADASAQERTILGAITYQPNDVVLHTDAHLLPHRRKAWAAWNAWIPKQPGAACTVSYCMNILQNIRSPEPLVVTLNRSTAIDPGKVLHRMRYHHPVYTHTAFTAQRRKAEIQGRRHTWFAGAYWGFGFHEDGMRSAVEVAHALGVDWPLADIAATAGAAAA
ncbi:MAG: FAD-dependent oxidoreductase [Nevskiaceae bacterium]|nr:MAG: FAD-dependent oxidoreductase [Nevskiaceae bacterium]TBR71684.1 MAG: FAD-dependent oxidoreductase [Nevskiaceae bacterium]